MKVNLFFVVFCLLTAACVRITPQPTAAPTDQSNLPNPASFYCKEQGYISEIRTAADGSQSGVCIFPDGSECDEWAYYRGECKPASSNANLPNPASAYCKEQGYISEIRTAADGSQIGVCIFPDGSECDEWAYFRGECTPPEASSFLPNPASAYCVEQGYTSEIRTAADGSQSGVCIFPDGSECDEWAYFRGECKPGDSLPPDSSAWATYTNDALGYRFQYPAQAELIIADEPKKSLTLSGPGMGDEFWSISHPADLDQFRPPAGSDLLQWLTDHYLLGEVRLPDEQIAGTTAIHFRHERSPQSPADDRYYFAHNGQLYMLLIGHGSETEDWELDNRFLQSFEFFEPDQGASSTAIPTALPVDAPLYQDWQTYTHPDNAFSFRFPDDWVVEQDPSGDPLLAGHELILRTVHESQKQTIRITFRSMGDDTLLWPTGVGQGEFVPQGTLDIAGQPAQRVLLVCPTGEVTSIWYHATDQQPNILRGGLEFGFIFRASEHCDPGYSLGGVPQQVGEAIISSLQVP